MKGSGDGNKEELYSMLNHWFECDALLLEQRRVPYYEVTEDDGKGNNPGVDVCQKMSPPTVGLMLVTSTLRHGLSVDVRLQPREKSRSRKEVVSGGVDCL